MGFPLLLPYHPLVAVRLRTGHRGRRDRLRNGRHGLLPYALLMDLADIEGNVSDGVHIASAGGVWLAIAYGFAGLRDFDGRLSFDPALPTQWSRLDSRRETSGRHRPVVGWHLLRASPHTEGCQRSVVRVTRAAHGRGALDCHERAPATRC